MKVVLPKPDSPATMIVKAAPRLATILWRWLGSCARRCQLWHPHMERHGVGHTLAMPMGLADSAMTSARCVGMGGGGGCRSGEVGAVRSEGTWKAPGGKVSGESTGEMESVSASLIETSSIVESLFRGGCCLLEGWWVKRRAAYL